MTTLTRRLLGRWPTVPPYLVDVGIAAAVAAVVDIAIHVANEPGERSADLVAYLLGAAIGAVLLARRHRPLVVLLATAAILFLYYSVGYPGFEPALPLTVALYTASAAGYLRWSVAVATFFVAAGVFVGLVRLKDPLLTLFTGALQEVALFGVVILLGETVRTRRIRLAEARDRLAEAERGRDREAARRVAEERLRIARDVHDIVGHAIAAVTLQAGLAQDQFDSRPVQARAALDVVVRTARTAMADIKATLGVLRSGDTPADDRMPVPGLSDVDKLVEQLGVPVRMSVTGSSRTLPGVVELTAFRIIQESLTNVLKHAEATFATVTIHYGTAELTVEVINDGTRAVEGKAPGYGLIGMRERITAVAGKLEAGPRTEGGFRVFARIPVQEEGS